MMFTHVSSGEEKNHFTDRREIADRRVHSGSSREMKQVMVQYRSAAYGSLSRIKDALELYDRPSTEAMTALNQVQSSRNALSTWCDCKDEHMLPRTR